LLVSARLTLGIERPGWAVIRKRERRFTLELRGLQHLRRVKL
jgi:hypothetical protein